MKRENFNLNISTLDDKVLYQEICQNIRDTEIISLKLLLWVPFVSGIGMALLWLGIELVSLIAMIFIAAFGAMVTFFLYLWEKRNLQAGNTFRRYASMIEIRKSELESNQLDDNLDGPFTSFINAGKPHLFAKNASKKGWGKGKAEAAIYGIIIIFWLSLPILALFFA